ncbi:MAG: hypothetical protein WCP57_10870 [Bacteroidota bacterium]
MKHSLSSIVKLLSSIIYTFDETSNTQKKEVLAASKQIDLSNSKYIIAYHDMLLYILAYPANKEIYTFACNALELLSKHFKNKAIANQVAFENSGLPYTRMYSRFTTDYCTWMITHTECTISLYEFEKEGTSLNDILKICLPSIEQEITSAGLLNEELLDSLNIKSKDRLHFLLNSLSYFDAQLKVKDFIWESLKPITEVYFKDARCSRSWNAVAVKNLFYHSEILKKFDHEALLNQAVAPAKKLNKEDKFKLVEVIRKNLLLTMRETDPVTYMDENSLHYFELERGISVALFGMQAVRQLPTCSYVGYTLFKNGYPVSYGGSWLIGETANFGINIFEPYRGGESGYTLIQLLRVYRQLFGINYFEIEPYQFGQDNPDGIKTGAFWFYYRFGFRPVDPKLAKLAANEFKKIQSIKGYRSTEATLIQFTESNLALQLGDVKGLSFSTIRESTSSFIQTHYQGNRARAVQESMAAFARISDMPIPKNNLLLMAYETFSLVSASLQIKDKKRLDLLVQMIHAKSSDMVKFNFLLGRFIKTINK